MFDDKKSDTSIRAIINAILIFLLLVFIIGLFKSIADHWSIVDLVVFTFMILGLRFFFLWLRGK